ncbi:hypothetical protein GEMRC1_008239 [Eukaryota sp. GEM-RC1]
MPHCPNCLQEVPQGNWMLHKLQCVRNVTKCPHCNEPVSLTSLSDHIQEQHAIVTCVCGERMEARDLEIHKSQHCRNRPIKCAYCDLALPLGEIMEHEKECGSRSTDCENCGQRVRLADLEQHFLSNCQQKVVGQSPRAPEPSYPSRRPPRHDFLYEQEPPIYSPP